MRAESAGLQPRRCQGQALTELLVVSLALVPLAILLVMLGKYQGLGTATIAASRTAAFECAARPSACPGGEAQETIRQSIGPAHFGQPDRPPLWQDRAGRPLLERFEDVGIRIEPLVFDAGLANAARRSGAGVAFDRLAGPARFGLRIEEGLLRADVSTRVAPSFAGRAGFARLEPLALTIRARTAILTDTWQGSGPREGPRSAESVVARGARLDSLRELRLEAGYQLTRWSLDLMGAIGLEPSASSFRPLGPDPDVLPADRVGAQ
jgi:hypothetical protein